MIGFIKKLFSGIISFVVGLFGGKKSLENKSTSSAGKLEADGKKRKRNGYFMELDEADEQKQSANGNQPAPAKVEKAKTPEPAAKTAKTPEPAAKTAKPEPAKTTKQEPAQKAASNKKPVQVELVQTAEGVKAEPAKPVSAPVAATNGQTSSENTFAPKYLTPTNSNSRRRPGPSMSNFLDMARQVKTPN